MNILRRQESGFTLVELVVSMAIFSFVILIMLFSLTQLFRTYQAGYQIRDTQQNARTLAVKMTRDIESGDKIAVAGTTLDANMLCIFQSEQQSGNVWEGIRYYTAGSGVGTRVERVQSSISLPPGADPVCADITGATPERVTSETVRVRQFFASAVGGDRMVRVKLAISAATGDTEFIVGNAGTGFSCSADPGSQYCSLTAIEVAALTRKGTR